MTIRITETSINIRRTKIYFCGMYVIKISKLFKIVVFQQEKLSRNTKPACICRKMLLSSQFLLSREGAFVNNRDTG